MSVVLSPTVVAFGAGQIGLTQLQEFTLKNNGTSPVLVTAINLGGTNPTHFPVFGILLPVKLDPGETVPFSMEFWAIDNGLYTATLSTVISDGSDPGASMSGGPNTLPALGPNDSYLVFDKTVTAELPFFINGPSPAVSIITCHNLGPGAVNITGVTADPTEPAVLGSFSGAFPIIVPSGGSFTFELEWSTPTPVTDFLDYYTNAAPLLQTTNTSGGTSQLGQLIATGYMVGFSPINPTLGISPALWLAIAGRLFQPDPSSLSCEENSQLLRQYDFGIPIYEKNLLRWAVRYENLGQAAINIIVTTARQTITQQIQIGTIAADGKVYTSYFDINTSDELFAVQIFTVPNGGPVSIVDMYPQFEPAGEYVEGT